MNSKYTPFYVIGFGVLTGALIIAGAALAQAPIGPADAGIRYPVAELGNCKDREACKTYCDNPANLKACVAFAEKNNLMSKDEINVAKKFINAGAKGPGGCTSKDSCEAYCNNMSRINECVAFAEKTGILPPDQLAEAKQVQAAIAKGVTPPPCGNKKECDTYCDEPSHMKVCVAFGEAAGFLQGKDLEDAKKMMAAMDKGATPPPCKGKDACDAYCSDSAHMETCMTFAQAAGLMSPQEAQDSQKMLQALKKGVKPPACRGKEECDKYCSEDAHFEECMNFSVAAGFMSEKDAEMARKTGGKGPGGCKGKDECEAFCNNPDNQQTCFNFGRDNGLIPPEELQKIEEGQKQFQESFRNMPPQVLICLQSSIGGDTLEKFRSGQAMPSRDVGEKMGQCFSQMGGPGQGQGAVPGAPGARGQMPPGQPGTPGPQGNFPGGMGATSSFAGPGGCKTPEECKTLCMSDPEACKNFQPPAMQPGMTPPTGTRPMMQPGTMQPPMGMQPPTGSMPLPGGMQPPPGSMQPPPGGMPPTGSYQQLQPGTYQSLPLLQPTSTTAPPPPTSLQNRGFLGALIELFRPVFGL